MRNLEVSVVCREEIVNMSTGMVPTDRNCLVEINKCYILWL